MSIPFIQSAFAAGEIGPALYGHVDLAKFSIAASTMRNMFVNYRGGAYSRPGFAYVGRCKQLGTLAPPRDIPFQFSINQGYVLEFGDNYMRVKYRGGYVTETAKLVTGITQANPAVVTSNGHGFSNGDWVFLTGINGMTVVNGQTYTILGVTANTFQLVDLFGSFVDSTRFPTFTGGGTVARLFTLVTPYAAVDLQYLKYTQSADVMSLTCVNQVTGTEYPPMDLTRISATNWTIAFPNFAGHVSPPASCTAVATTAANPAGTPPTFATAYAYCVTAVDPDTGEESIASSIGNALNSVDIAVTAGSVIVTWAPVTGKNYTYNIYKAPPSFNTGATTSTANPVPAGSLFGYAGTSYGTQFVDTNIVQDMSQVPPLHRNPFARGQILNVNITGGGAAITGAVTPVITTGTGGGFVGIPVVIGGVLQNVVVQDPGHDYLLGDTIAFTVGGGTPPTGTLTIGAQTGTYPGVVSYFQQRRVYGFTLNKPDYYFMSQPGLFLDFDARIPTIDSDAITGSPWSLQVNGIQWMLTMPGGLIVMTGKGAWQLGGSGSSGANPQPISPSSQQAQPQAFNGVSPTVPPIPINYDILYVQAKGSSVRDLNYNFWVNIYTGIDLTILSSQLFSGHTIVSWAWSEEPYKVLWATRDDGLLLSLTYLKDQEVYGWARHDSPGCVYASVCSIVEPPVDAVYAITLRFINGQRVYYSERMDNRLWTTSEDPWCVDCGLATQPQVTVNGSISASSRETTHNSVLFSITSNDFTAGMAGYVVRLFGGVAVLDTIVSSSAFRGHWTIPPGEGEPISAIAGNWTITAPYVSVGGLQHLTGLTVVGLADGVPIGPFAVPASGTITLPFLATNVKLGLSFIPQLQSVYAPVPGQPTAQGRRKSISAVTVRVDASSGFQVGSNQPDGAAQTPPAISPSWSNMATSSPQGQAFLTPAGTTGHQLFTGDVRVPIVSSWQKPGQAAVQQLLPLPLNVTALIPEVLEGDLPEAKAEKPEQGKGESRRGPGMWMLKAAA